MPVSQETLDEIALTREEYDRVLGKARAKGAPSLTPEERAFMERLAERAKR